MTPSRQRRGFAIAARAVSTSTLFPRRSSRMHSTSFRAPNRCRPTSSHQHDHQDHLTLQAEILQAFHFSRPHSCSPRTLRPRHFRRAPARCPPGHRDQREACQAGHQPSKPKGPDWGGSPRSTWPSGDRNQVGGRPRLREPTDRGRSRADLARPAELAEDDRTCPRVDGLHHVVAQLTTHP